LKYALIKGVKYEWIETLNVMEQGDISKEEYDNMIKLCFRCSRGSTRTRSGIRDPLNRTSRTIGGGVTRVEIGNLLEDFYADILSTLTT